MSKITNSAFALAASVALGAGTMMAGSAAPAQAAVCSSKPSVHCSIQYARQINSSLPYGTTGESVRNLQKAMRQLRYPVAVTGKLDFQTARYLRQYQHSRGLSVHSSLTNETLRALRIGAGVHIKVSAASRSTSRGVTSSVAVSSRAQAAVNYAYAHLGAPYVYGATGPRSFDCSGLTSTAWRAAGVSVPRTSYGQMGLSRVSKSDLQPGDIVVFYGGGHVGIYVGGGQVIHAPHTGDVVRVASLNSMPFTAAVRP